MAGPRVTNNLPAFVRDRQQRAASAMTQALILGASEASVMTPIDTSTLLNSQYRDVGLQGDQVRGRVGYTAEYALPVHSPDHPQNFRRATARKEFLRLGFEAQEPAIAATFQRALKA